MQLLFTIDVDSCRAVTDLVNNGQVAEVPTSSGEHDRIIRSPLCTIEIRSQGQSENRGSRGAPNANDQLSATNSASILKCTKPGKTPLLAQNASCIPGPSELRDVSRGSTTFAAILPDQDLFDLLRRVAVTHRQRQAKERDLEQELCRLDAGIEKANARIAGLRRQVITNEHQREIELRVGRDKRDELEREQEVVRRRLVDFDQVHKSQLHSLEKLVDQLFEGQDQDVEHGDSTRISPGYSVKSLPPDHSQEHHTPSQHGSGATTGDAGTPLPWSDAFIKPRSSCAKPAERPAVQASAQIESAGPVIASRQQMGLSGPAKPRCHVTQVEGRQKKEELAYNYDSYKPVREAASILFDNRDEEFEKDIDDWYDRLAAGEKVEPMEAMDLRHLYRSMQLTRNLLSHERSLAAVREKVVAAGGVQCGESASSCFVDHESDGYPDILCEKGMSPGEILERKEWRGTIQQWVNGLTDAPMITKGRARRQSAIIPELDDWPAASVNNEESFSAVAIGKGRRRIDRWRGVCDAARAKFTTLVTRINGASQAGRASE